MWSDNAVRNEQNAGQNDSCGFHDIFQQYVVVYLFRDTKVVAAWFSQSSFTLLNYGLFFLTTPAPIGLDDE